MAWTTPRTWVAGEVVTAAIMNTHVRDNFSAISQSVQAHLSGNVNHTSSGNFQTLSFDAEDFDTNTMHDTVTNPSRLTCKVAGNYLVFGQIVFAAETGALGARVSKNGSTVYDNRAAGVATSGNGAAIVLCLSLAVNDYVELAGMQTSGGTLAMLGGSGGSGSFFGMSAQGGNAP